MAPDVDDARARPAHGSPGERAVDEQLLEAPPVEMPSVPVGQEQEGHLVSDLAPHADR